MTNVIELADGRTIAHLECIRWLVEVCVKILLNLGGYLFDFGIVQLGIIDDSVNESTL